MSRWDNYGPWDYYHENVPRKAKNGIKVKSTRGAIGETWWSQRWVSVLDSFGMGARLTRGRSYARMGQVLSINVEPGYAEAQVQGSRPRPYKVDIWLHMLSESQWEKVIDVMASQAIFAAKLLAGEMPQQIEEAFEAADVSLFPAISDELETDCSCPDWANPCKHIAAVYYVLAEMFDADPFLIFTLRGRTKDQIMSALRERRSASVTGEPQAEAKSTADEGATETAPLLEAHIDTFWNGTEVKDFVQNPFIEKVDKAVLKRLGDAPFPIGSTNLSKLFARAYDQVDKALMKIIMED